MTAWEPYFCFNNQAQGLAMLGFFPSILFVFFGLLKLALPHMHHSFDGLT